MFNMGFKELVMESKAEKAKTRAIKPETTGMFKLPVTFLKKIMYRRPGKQQKQQQISIDISILSKNARSDFAI